MGAISKLRGIRSVWIGYVVVATLVGAFRDGLDASTATDVVLQIAVASAFLWWVGARLLAKSSLIWAFVVVYCALGTIAAAVTIAHVVLGDGDLDAIGLAHAAAFAYVNIRTFRVLRDRDVKHYVMLD